MRKTSFLASLAASSVLASCSSVDPQITFLGAGFTTVPVPGAGDPTDPDTPRRPLYGSVVFGLSRSSDKRADIVMITDTAKYTYPGSALEMLKYANSAFDHRDITAYVVTEEAERIFNEHPELKQRFTNDYLAGDNERFRYLTSPGIEEFKKEGGNYLIALHRKLNR